MIILQIWRAPLGLNMLAAPEGDRTSRAGPRSLDAAGGG